MTLKLLKISNHIVQVSASSEDELASTFLRFQEHYESPEWKGKIFTLGQYRKWYAEQNGAFTYSQDWSGFNIPSYVLNPFIQGMFDPLTKEEKIIVSWFKDRTDSFYVIGANSDANTLEHEICHGLWYTNKEYREKCLKVVKSLKKEDYLKIKSWLLNKGYHESVINDEIHAYISTEKDLSHYGLDLSISKHHLELRSIRNKINK